MSTPPAGSNTMLESALALASGGYKVFPVKSGDSKAPNNEHGFYGGTTNPRKIRRQAHKFENIAVATGLASELAVVDADGPETVAFMREHYGEPTVWTRRGAHWWYAYPPDKVTSGPLKHIQESIGTTEDLQLKAKDGLVLVPPSANRTWVDGVPNLHDLPELPPELRKAKPEPKPRTNGELPQELRERLVAAVSEHYANLPEGSRHANLLPLCASLMSSIDDEDAQGIVEAAWETIDLGNRVRQGEVARTVADTRTAMDNDAQYQGRPTLEREMPELYEALDKALGWTYRGRITSGTPSKNGNHPPEQEAPEPVMRDAAYAGLPGAVVDLVDPHTEADPVAVLLTFLTEMGNAVGRSPHFYISATRHHPNLFTGIVGDTSRSRKGTSADPVAYLMQAADSLWASTRTVSGLSSGEGLIHEIRDPLEDADGEITDAGVPDKRLMVVEGELAQALKQMSRHGNTLSPVLRNAWDGKPLRTLTKHSPTRCDRPHVSIVGHITRTELRRTLTEVEMANGLANRFLWAVVKRSKLLPFGGEWRKVNVAPITSHIRSVLDTFDTDTEMDWADDDARELWADAYEQALTVDRGGMFGAITARAEAQALRLAMLYAICDSSRVIRADHIQSALAVWQYSEDSALALFGGSVGNADADKVLSEIQSCGELSRTEVRDLFDRNKGKQELDQLKDMLVESGKVEIAYAKIDGSRKRSEIWRAAE